MNQTDRVFHCFDPLDATRPFENYRSCSPETREELFSYTHLVLGDFTSSTLLPSILVRGLEPDFNKQRAKDDKVPSDAESVYLCARYNKFYPSRAVKYHGGTGIAVLTRVLVSSLAPDESALTPVQFEQHKPDELLFLSFRFGACKHRGVVPSSCFVGVYDIEGKRLL